MLLTGLVIGVVVGVAIGAAGYRRMLKKNGPLLKKWAREIKEAAERVSD